MNNFDIDTKELYNLGSDIMRLSNELNEEFEGLFNRLAGMSKKTGEWVGDSANSYIDKTKIEKSDYIKYKNSLYNYGKTLCDIATEYETNISKVGV